MYTQSLRSAHRQAEFFLRKVNFELRNNGVFFKLGKNLLWIELHLVTGTSQGRFETKILVNLSKPPKAASETAPFQPQLSQLQQAPWKEGFIEKEALEKADKERRLGTLKSVPPVQPGSPEQVQGTEMSEQQMKAMDEEMKMTNKL